MKGLQAQYWAAGRALSEARSSKDRKAIRKALAAWWEVRHAVEAELAQRMRRYDPWSLPI